MSPDRLRERNGTRLTLDGETAADLMVPNPVAVRDLATVAEVVTLLTDRGLSAVPVIDPAGRPVGVVSKADVLAHDRERMHRRADDRHGASQVHEAGAADPTRARDIMTPALFSVAPETPAARIVDQLAALNVHQLFVVDRDGALLGVIGALDLLRRLHP